MKKLYILLFPFLLSSCLGFKMSRVYEPSKLDNLIQGLEVKFDTASIEHAMFQDRLKLEFITENKKTNSTLYSYEYYKDISWPVDMKSYLVSPGYNYRKTSILDLPTFEMNYMHYLVNDDTLLFKKGLEGVEQYYMKTKKSLNRIPGTASISNKDKNNEVVTLVNPLRNQYTQTQRLNNNAALNLDSNNQPILPVEDLINGMASYSPILTYGDFVGKMALGAISAIYEASEERNELKSIHNYGGELTSKVNNKDLVLLNEYSRNGLPTISDSYRLIRDFTYNEIASPSNVNQNNYKGYIVYRIIDKEYRFEFPFWMISSTLLLFVPNLFGYPIASQKIKITMEASIYDKNNNKIKTYISQGKGKAYCALYWGYGVLGAMNSYMPNAMSRTANSKAIYSSLSGLLKQMDKYEIEKLLK